MLLRLIGWLTLGMWSWELECYVQMQTGWLVSLGDALSAEAGYLNTHKDCSWLFSFALVLLLFPVGCMAWGCSLIDWWLVLPTDSGRERLQLVSSYMSKEMKRCGSLCWVGKLVSSLQRFTARSAAGSIFWKAGLLEASWLKAEFSGALTPMAACDRQMMVQQVGFLRKSAKFLLVRMYWSLMRLEVTSFQTKCSLMSIFLF
jgi:hypothetical protein